MGSFLTRFHDYRTGFAPDLTSALQKDWITLHAELTGLSIVEVERLWARFQQLGCDKEGVLYVKDMKRNPRFSDDIFMKNLLISLAIDHKIYFQTFVNCMKWADNASSDEKCKAIYSFFNQDQPLPNDLFRKILTRAYPDKDEATVNQYSSIVFKKLSSGSDDLEYSDFMKFCYGSSSQELGRILDFEIIPGDINVEAHRRFSWQNGGSARNHSDDVKVSDESLKELSLIITQQRMDWRQLGSRLGYSDQQLNTYERQIADIKQRVYKMLTTWKIINNDDATKATLRRHLGNNVTLNPHVFG